MAHCGFRFSGKCKDEKHANEDCSILRLLHCEERKKREELVAHVREVVAEYDRYMAMR